MGFLTGTRLGPYEITGPLGKGGMGEVYRARDSRLHRSVAIKILAPHASDSESARRFEREARAVASLMHPHVVALFDIGEQDGVAYVVTELVEGETLRERLARGALRMEEAVELAAQVAEGLSAAHARGLIHRDIKPENIVITPEGRAKILDFGLVKENPISPGAPSSEAEPTASVMTEPGMISGTVGYMSPEQVRGEPVDARSDIFALGSVLYEMLTGERAFAGDSKIERLHAILKTEPALPHPDAPIPEELTRILQRCLAKGKEHRYHSAADLAHDLRAISPAGRSIPAMPAPRRSFSFGGRRALWLGLAAAAVSALAFLLLRSRTAGPVRPRTIAVLPFQTVGAEPAPRFGLGLADSLIGRLAAVRDLTVRPTSAVTRFEGGSTDAIQAGRQLGVEAVLEGRFQKLEGMTRVTVQLTDVGRGAIVWSDRLDLPEGRLFEVQDEIATRVVDRLRLELAPGERERLQSGQQVPDDVMEEFFAARARLPETIRMSSAGRREMVAQFDRILERAPSFARAIGGRSYARAMLNFQEPSPDGFQVALRDAERALSLDPDLPEPRVARATLFWSFHGGWKVVEAVRELKTAIARNPGSEVAHLDLARLYYHTGWLEESRKAAEPARRLNPGSPEGIRIEAQIAWYGGDLRRGLMEYRRLPAELLRETLAGRWQVAHLRLFLEDPKAILSEAEAWVRELPEGAPNRWIPYALLAVARVRNGQTDIGDVEREIESANRAFYAGHFHHVDHLLGEAHALRGDAARAVDYLRRASETGLNCVPCFETDPFLEAIRPTAEYRALKAEMTKRDAAFALR